MSQVPGASWSQVATSSSCIFRYQPHLSRDTEKRVSAAIKVAVVLASVFHASPCTTVGVALCKRWLWRRRLGG